MFIQLSYKIDADTPAYGGKEVFSSIPQSSIEKGDSANTTKWQFSNHLGTHIDFPYHFYQQGQTVEDFSEDFWIIEGNKIQILEANLHKGNLLIKPDNIYTKNLNLDVEFLIFQTGYSRYRSEEKYWKYNPGVDIETVEWIKKTFKKIRMIGIDSISISSWQYRDIGRKVHKKMLNPKKPILIVEDMNLLKVNKDTVFKRIYVAPLMISRSDGGPCTILAEVINQ